MKFLFFLILLSFKGAYAEVSQTVDIDLSYIESLEVFAQRISSQIHETLMPQISNSELSFQQKEEIFKIVSQFESEVLQGLEKQKELYKNGFIQIPAEGLARKELSQLSMNIKWAVELAQFEFIAAIKLMNAKSSYYKIKKRFDHVALLSADLAANRNVRIPTKVMLNAFVARSEKFLRALIGVIFMALTNRKLNKIIDWTPREPLTKQKTPIDYKFYSENGVTQEFSTLPKDAVFILAMNHDFGSLDGKEIKEFSKAIGVDRNLIVTTSGSWPQMRIFGNPDPDILLIEDKMWMSRAIEAFERQKTGTISLSIFPEGAVPLWGTQAPLIAHQGTFRLARLAADHLRGVKPVYYVRITSNFLTHVTSGGEVPLALTIRNPERVPDTPVIKGDNQDPWIRKTRLEFEQIANQHRQQMYDLVKPAYLPDSLVFRVRSFPNPKTSPSTGLKPSCQNLFIK